MELTQARYEFIGGPWNTERLRVPANDDGTPLSQVFVQLGRPESRQYYLDVDAGFPQATTDYFTRACVTYRLNQDPTSKVVTFHLEPAPAPAVPPTTQLELAYERWLNRVR